jgi:hypothetical protein
MRTVQAGWMKNIASDLTADKLGKRLMKLQARSDITDLIGCVIT